MDLRKPTQKPESVWVNIACEVCGKDYRALKQIDCYGEEHYPVRSKCRECGEKERLQQYIKEAQEILPNEIKIQREKWFQEIMIPSKFVEKAKAGFGKFDSKLQPKAFKAVKDFDGHSIILYSTELYGLGKTHLVSCLAWHLLETSKAVEISNDGRIIRYHCPVYFTREVDLLARIRATYNHQEDHETEEMVYRSLSKHALLIIDDVGKIRPQKLDFLQGVYFRIIDERYTREKSIILTTNLDLPGLENHIGGACSDRLREMCGSAKNVVKMTGKSYRVNNEPGKKGFEPVPEKSKYDEVW